MVFEHTGEVIQAEDILKREGWEVRVMGPPPEVRTGCDLVIEFPLIEELNILRVLDESGVVPLQLLLSSICSVRFRSLYSGLLLYSPGYNLLTQSGQMP